MALETKARHPRDTRPFGTADHRIETAYGDAELVKMLDYLADEQWIPFAPIPITHVDNGEEIVVMWKIPAWRSHSLRYEPDPAIVETENRERRENRSRHQEAAAALPDKAIEMIPDLVGSDLPFDGESEK